MLDEHSAGRANHRLLIWSLLCFEWWNRLFIDGERPTATGMALDDPAAEALSERRTSALAAAAGSA